LPLQTNHNTITTATTATTARLEAFLEAEFIHSALKFPTTRNGREILANPEYKKRITLVEGPNFPMLEQYSEKLIFIGFNQVRSVKHRLVLISA
jgi:hypothetical protein